MNIKIEFRDSENNDKVELLKVIERFYVKSCRAQSVDTEEGEVYMIEGKPDVVVTCHRLPDPPKKRKVDEPRIGSSPSDYKACYLWQIRLGSFTAYAIKMRELAFEAKQPIDVIYCDHTGKWFSVRDLADAHWFRKDLLENNISFN